MGLLDFVTDAGEKLFGLGKYSEEATNQAKEEALTNHVKTLELPVNGFQVKFDDGVATLAGVVPTQRDKEKVILAIGNTQGVSQVNDMLTVEPQEPKATFYTVKSGDSLSKIAKTHYGDPMKYPEIFEANKPMLSHPDKIYPGQVLRIPSLG